jgi:hypothetical protein
MRGNNGLGGSGGIGRGNIGRCGLGHKRLRGRGGTNRWGSNGLGGSGGTSGGIKSKSSTCNDKYLRLWFSKFTNSCQTRSLPYKMHKVC